MLNASKNSIKLFILGNRSQSQRNCCKHDTGRHQTILNYGRDTSSFHSSSWASVTSLRKGRGKKKKTSCREGDRAAGTHKRCWDWGGDTTKKNSKWEVQVLPCRKDSLQNQLVLSSNITSSWANFPSTTQTAAMFDATPGNTPHHPQHHSMPAKQNR